MTLLHFTLQGHGWDLFDSSRCHSALNTLLLAADLFWTEILRVSTATIRGAEDGMLVKLSNQLSFKRCITFFCTAPRPGLLCCSGCGRRLIHYWLMLYRWWDWIIVVSRLGSATTHRSYNRLLVWWCYHYALWLPRVTVLDWASHHRRSILLPIDSAKHMPALAIRWHVSFQVNLTAVISFKCALVGYIFNWLIHLTAYTTRLDLRGRSCSLFHSAAAPSPIRLLTRRKQL